MTTSGTPPIIGAPGMSLGAERLPGYAQLTSCRFCLSSSLLTFLDFGSVPLAGGFLRRDQIAEEVRYPLTMKYCEDCTAVQAGDVVSGDVLFNEYFYFSSAIETLRTHFTELAGEVQGRFATTEESLVVEIGCNDGVFLRPAREMGMLAIGVDPASNVVQSVEGEGLHIINDFFTEEVAQRIRGEFGPASVVVSSYSFAHIDDIIDVTHGVKALLKEDGVFIIEVYYLSVLLSETQYDMMYHEHMSYYSLGALERFLERFDMEVFDIRQIPLRAGTLRFYVRNRRSGDPPVSDATNELRESERAQGLHRTETYLEFGHRVETTRTDLLEILTGARDRGKRLIGYGASGRGTVIMNYCGVGSEYLECVVDDAPAKHGLHTPGMHVPIRPWSDVKDDPPDYALLFAWSFAEEVMKRREEYVRGGGKFIVPLPSPRVVPR